MHSPAPHFLQTYRTLRALCRDSLTNSRWFDVAFTPGSLQHRLEEQSNCFIEDAFGGLRCRRCNLPATYHTLHLSVFVNGRPIGMTTTRYLPMCVMCHEFEGAVGRLCFTTEEAVAARLVHQPPQADANENRTTSGPGECGGLTEQES
jgi:hypothetical protein